MRHSTTKDSLNLGYKIGFCLFLTLLLAACKKEKTSLKEDNRLQQELLLPSKIRIINLSGYNQVAVDSDTLTSSDMLVGGGESSTEITSKGTPFFPSKGFLEMIWRVPRSVLKGSNPVKVDLYDRFNNGGISIPELSFQLKEEGNQAIDYYVWNSFLAEELQYKQQKVVPIPRAESGSQRPGFIKIRLLNLGSKLMPPSNNAEDLMDAYSLHYADGKSVHSKLAKVGQGECSEYIEIPYGTYQFRVMTSDKRQLPYGKSPNLSESLAAIDPRTSSLAKSYEVGQYITFVPIKHYAAGSAYTIVVSPKWLPYITSEVGGSSSYPQNAMEIIEDVSPPVNINLAKIQAVNIFSENQEFTFQLEGTELSAGLGYAQSSDYQVVSKGTYRLDAISKKGNLKVSTEVLIHENDNITVWLSADAVGKPKLQVAYNNLSGSWAKEGIREDATYGKNIQQFPFNVRFLNFCVDVPLLTVARGTGDKISGDLMFQTLFNDEPKASRNLKFGEVLKEAPLVSMSDSRQTDFSIYAFQSSAQSVPGNWLSNIKAFPAQDFIVNKSLYQVRGHLPNYERGFFTIALIGSNNAKTAAGKPKFFLVKHNQ